MKLLKKHSFLTYLVLLGTITPLLFMGYDHYYNVNNIFTYNGAAGPFRVNNTDPNKPVLTITKEPVTRFIPGEKFGYVSDLCLKDTVSEIYWRYVVNSDTHQVVDIAYYIYGPGKRGCGPIERISSSKKEWAYGNYSIIRHLELTNNGITFTVNLPSLNFKLCRTNDDYSCS